jgi:predicted nucleotidyltransferase
MDHVEGRHQPGRGPMAPARPDPGCGVERTRAEVTEFLRRTAEALPAVLAAYEGGSAAHGRLDAWSDLDLQLIVEPGRGTAVLDALERELEGHFGVELRWVLPEPTWHGHPQRFLRLRGTSPFLLLDLVAIAADAGQRFVDLDRDGRVVVWFDRGAGVLPTQLPPEEWRRRLAARLAELRARFPITQCLVEKELLRGHGLEALSFYQAFCLRPLIELLRLIHAPRRHDFHTRYLDRDLPPEALRRLERLSFPAGPRDLAGLQAEVQEWFHGSLAAAERAIDERVIDEQGGA